MHIASTTALTSHSAYHAATTATAPSWQGRTPKDSMPPRRRQAAGRQRLGWYCLGLLLTACIDTAPADSGTIAPIKSTGTRVTLQVRDARQHPWPPLAMPRRPQLWLHAEPALRPSPDAIWLLSVQPGADLRRDLEGKPLRQAHQALAVPLDHAVHAADLQLQVQGTLAPDQDYTLAVAAWAEDVGEGRIATPLLFPLHTAIDAGGGAIRDSWPADGSAGVPPALPWVAVRFDQAVADTSAPATGWLRWVDEGGEPVHHTARWIDCHRIGWHTGQCLELRPSAPLAPGTHHRLELDEAATDGTGATLSPWQASFITADADAPSDDAIQWQPLDCAPGQRALPIGCLDI
ncbi:MAG: Ig-like domain-containing protein, partial [Polyangiales bacterium]